MTESNQLARRDDFLAGLDLDQLRPDAIVSFLASLPGRTGAILTRVAEHEEESGASHPQAAEAARSTAEEIRQELAQLDELLDGAGLPTRPGHGADRTSDSGDEMISSLSAVADRALGRLSTATSVDWTTGSPTLLDRSRTAVGELAWLLHLGQARVEGHLTAP